MRASRGNKRDLKSILTITRYFYTKDSDQILEQDRTYIILIVPELSTVHICVNCTYICVNCTYYIYIICICMYLLVGVRYLLVRWW